MGNQKSIQSREKSVDKKEKELMQKILETQFEYSTRLMKKEIKFLNGEYVDINSSEDVVKNWTRIPTEIKNAYCKRTGKKRSGLKEDLVYKEALNKIVGEICLKYEKGCSLEFLSSKSFDVIFDVVNALPEPVGVESLREQNKRAGVFEYNVYRPDEKEAEQYGIDHLKDYIDIHFAALFKQQAESGKEHLTRANLEEEIKKSCRQLALAIETTHPNVAGVICTSWLIDTDWFVGAVGFDKEESILVNGNGFTKDGSFWGQFIGANGELKKERVQNLLKGQKPKYGAKFNFISRERFLEIHAGKE